MTTACKACGVVTADPQASEVLDEILLEGLIPNTMIAAALTRNGFPVTEASIRRHKMHLEGAV